MVLIKSLRFIFASFLIFWQIVSAISAPKLSNRAQVSLITISPGPELYSAFGHSTLWVVDPLNGVDRVYNYGTFDFNQPNFYWNFVKGHLDYTLSVYTFQEQFLQTQYEGRGLTQQILNLDSVQRQKVYDFLERNALPENAHYMYDFYLDNCSTRLRDVLKKACGEDLQYDKSLASPYSYREWMNLFLGNFPWSSIGMNVGLGSPSDRKTDYLTQMYLPINLKMALSNATLNGKAIVLQENEILYPLDKESKASNAILSFGIAIFFISLILVFSKEKFGVLGSAFDFIFFFSVFVLGSILAFLWLATDHWVCAWNTDLLWANPLAFFLIYLISGRKISNTIRYICYGYLILCFFYYSIAFVFTEKPIFVLFPTILALQLRILYRLRRSDLETRSIV